MQLSADTEFNIDTESVIGTADVKFFTGHVGVCKKMGSEGNKRTTVIGIIDQSYT